MKIKVNPGSPSLRTFLNKGGTFKAWRHEHTNYDRVRRRLHNDEEYEQMVYQWGLELIDTLTLRQHQREVAEYIIARTNKWKK